MFDLPRQQVELGAGVGCDGRESVVEVVREGAEGELEPLDRAALAVQQMVHGHAVHPGGEGRLAVERRHPGEELHKDLLGRVEGVVGAAGHPQGEAMDVVADGDEDGLYGVPVAALRTLDKVGEVVDGHGLSTTTSQRPSGCCRTTSALRPP